VPALKAIKAYYTSVTGPDVPIYKWKVADSATSPCIGISRSFVEVLDHDIRRGGWVLADFKRNGLVSVVKFDALSTGRAEMMTVVCQNLLNIRELNLSTTVLRNLVVFRGKDGYWYLRFHLKPVFEEMCKLPPYKPVADVVSDKDEIPLTKRDAFIQVEQNKLWRSGPRSVTQTH
jgi:hypothetical protein